jgi:hypothetical protein
MYWFAQQMANSTWAPLLGETANSRFAADPELVTRMVRILGRDLAASKLLTPAATASIVAEALRRNPGKRGQVAREVGGIVVEELRRLRSRARLAQKPAG